MRRLLYIVRNSLLRPLTLRATTSGSDALVAGHQATSESNFCMSACSSHTPASR